MGHATIAKMPRKLEVSKETAFRHLKIGRPPTEVDCAARRKQPARPLHATSHPPSPSHATTPYPRPAIVISLQRSKPTPTTLAHATNIPSASNPKPSPQTSKQSRTCVRNGAWNSNRSAHPQNNSNSSTTCGFSFILQSLKCRYACRIVPVPITEKGPSCVSLPPASFPSRSRS